MTPTTRTIQSPRPGTPPEVPLPPNLSAIPLPNIPGISREQLAPIIQNLPPELLKQVLVDNKIDLMSALASVAQQAGLIQNGMVLGHPHPMDAISPARYPVVTDPGPSSHPQGPPTQFPMNLQALVAAAVPAQPEPAEEEDGKKRRKTGGKGRDNSTSGGDEWVRQRKDNHKEVERRRRNLINEGIDELGRIVPNCGSNETSKGSILSRAVQYIYHLKENEARNIEKWTLEKLLMEQAMTDLQSQLEQTKRMWEEDRKQLETELEILKEGNGGMNANAIGNKRATGTNEDSAESKNVKRVRTE